MQSYSFNGEETEPFVRAQERSRAGRWRWAVIGWVDCLAASRAPERSRAGMWRWALIAGWIVLLPAEPSRDQEHGGGDGLSFNRTSEDIKSYIIIGCHSWMDCVTA